MKKIIPKVFNVKKLKVIARNSKLSLKQVEEVFNELEKDIEYEVIPILSYGDKHKEISLMEDIPEDFFTRELDLALLKEEADIAIHSAKDLPYPLPEGIILAALTKGKTQLDALVSKGFTPLEKLPKGAKIGLSSLMRKNNILSIRKDLEIVPIRGTIEERLKLIDDGVVDAIIVAACALERLGLKDKITELLPFETHPLQGKLAVTVKEGRSDLIRLFYEIDERRFYGKVYLVGAGPGDKDLLTIKAKECLSYADIILYDDLISKEILDFGVKAKKLYVGKREGKHSHSQNEINKLMVKYAFSGMRVIRLKGGEPLIFGRAQEEIDYLLRRFINVEIINGVTSSFSAASSCNISLTNRECGSKIIFESGHLKGKEHLDKASSHVFYMGAGSIKEIYEKMKKEFPLETPVLIVKNASLVDETILNTNLARLTSVDISSPVIIIIGEACKFYNRQPKILYTGTNPYETLSRIPGVLIHYPVIKREKVKDFLELSDDEYDVIVFTSMFAVDVWTDFYGVKRNKRIYAIGKRTKERLIERGYTDVILPEKFNSIALSKLLKEKEKKARIIYPASSLSKNRITELENVRKITVYETTFIEQKKIDLKNFFGVYFASSSCVDGFLKIYEKIPSHLVLYAGGINTFEKLKTIGEEIRTVILEKEVENV